MEKKTYYVEIIEQLAHTVSVEAETPEQARELVEGMYDREEIILTADNSNVDVTFNNY